jgi:transformation/transcription domain-associated protein
VLSAAAPAQNAGQNASAGAPGPQASKETAAQQAFLAEYKPLVARDFFKQQDGTYPFATVKDLYLRLRKWQAAVRRQLARPSFPRQLESLSRPLSESKGQQMEVPGQYMSLKEPSPDQHVKVDRVLPDVELVERNGACHRRITIRGNDGKLYPFIVEATGSTIGMGDERTLQLCQLMNTCMEKEKQTRRRHMTLHVRPIIGLAPRCRLIADDLANVSLYDILYDFLGERGQTPDSVAIKFQEKTALLARSTTDPAMAAMNEIADLVPDTVC